MTNAPFAPLETHLDRSHALKILQSATQHADDGELFFERSNSETLMLDDQRLKTANYDASEGFGLRAVCGEVTGYAHSTEISEAAITRALSTVKRATNGASFNLADAPVRTNRALYDAFDPTSEVSFAAKVNVLKEIDDFLRGYDKRVVQVTASISTGCQEVVILRPEGDTWTDIRPMARVTIGVIVEQDGKRENGSAGGGGAIFDHRPT